MSSPTVRPDGADRRPSLLDRVRPWLATFTFSLSAALIGAVFVRAVA